MQWPYLLFVPTGLTSSIVARIANLWETGSLDNWSPETLMGNKEHFTCRRNVQQCQFTWQRCMLNKRTRQHQKPSNRPVQSSTRHQSDKRKVELVNESKTCCSLRCTCTQTSHMTRTVALGSNSKLHEYSDNGESWDDLQVMFANEN